MKDTISPKIDFIKENSANQHQIEVNVDEVVAFAQEFLENAQSELKSDEIRNNRKYAVMVENANDKLLLSKLLDESSQIRNPKKLAKRIKILFNHFGIPKFFSFFDKLQIKLFLLLSHRIDYLAITSFKRKLRRDTSRVIIDEEISALTKHLVKREEENIGQNVNLLGEVVLGENEANKRFYHYLEVLKNPLINYISVKLSGIYAHINPLNYQENVLVLSDLMSQIYQQAIDFPHIDKNGNPEYKFVNLDMEEYKDTELTIDVFKTTLSKPQFLKLRAGIVIQAYLPDATNFYNEILTFSTNRVEQGGVPLKIRLVKGANLQMEKIISSLKGWQNPVLGSKLEVDANYLHLLDIALKPDNVKVLNVGVASHNYFTISYANLLSEKRHVAKYVAFEMLEGMANHLPRLMRKLQKNIILYTPVVKDEHFLNAVSYLVRRLDENTGKENFLSYSFNLRSDTKQWEFLKRQFLDAYSLKDSVNNTPNRNQNRNKTVNSTIKIDEFTNEPDTNFDLPQNRKWIEIIKAKWKKSGIVTPYEIPIQIGGRTKKSGKQRNFLDHGQADSVIVCRANLASSDDVMEMLQIADRDLSGWRKTNLKERNIILHKVADNLRNKRGDLIGCMSAITGKTFHEGDVEVSEAIDFCRFYPNSMKTFEELENVSVSPSGIVLVIPPWNFPLAIPVGGVVAALSGGNSVILKPATTAYPVAWEFAQCFWEAGVPKDALQLFCAESHDSVNRLIKSPLIKHVILTGGTETAFRILETNSKCKLTAETGGKNAIILTSSGDRDHAIQNVVTSAFSNAGQKCSACSLFLVEKDVFEDPDFKTKLEDAVRSIKTGSQWEGSTIVGPMITNCNEKLQKAIEHLENGESWLVAPDFVDEKKYILRPAVKWNVKPGSYTFRTELFAPLLSVVVINDLREGIRLVNGGEYGLTSGLQTLDESEIETWKKGIEAGNLYINRGITGAIVQRQPFGGMKLSSFGGGIKAGGSNYVSCFVSMEPKPFVPKTQVTTCHFPDLCSLLDENEAQQFQQIIENYYQNWEAVFSKEELTQTIYGEKNTFRYLPVNKMVFRVNINDSLLNIVLVIASAEITGTHLTVSVDIEDPVYSMMKGEIGGCDRIVSETEHDFIKNLSTFDRIRMINENIANDIYSAASKLGKYIVSGSPLPEGRVELLHYLKEQSISYEYHRYGSISEDLNEN